MNSVSGQKKKQNDDQNYIDESLMPPAESDSEDYLQSYREKMEKEEAEKKEKQVASENKNTTRKSNSSSDQSAEKKKTNGASTTAALLFGSVMDSVFGKTTSSVTNSSGPKKQSKDFGFMPVENLAFVNDDVISIFSMRASNGIFWTKKHKKMHFLAHFWTKNSDFWPKIFHLMYASKRWK